MKRKFKNLKTGKHLSLPFHKGQVFFLSQWWDADFLKRNLSIAEDPEVVPLGAQQAPGFSPRVEAPAAFQNKFSPRKKK